MPHVDRDKRNEYSRKLYAENASRREYLRKYREENREKHKEYMRKYSLSNSDSRKEYADKNRERIRANDKERHARHRAARNAAMRERNRKTPEKRREYHLRRLYGLSIERFDEIFAAQGRCCAICRTDEPTKRGWFVDHCHHTEVVRGILCSHCNLMLGHAKDSEERLLAAISYLKIKR